ncbi:MAG: hypothetical protein M0R17_02395 [Candidatus Omnitrophica bacterium]|jgi:hypothetical protein|nr:hypothetical protein [Candidatus Omnitrophota bacterium]
MAEFFEGMRDIRLNYDLDINFKNGDLLTTTGIDYIQIEIYKLLITEPGDWKASPKLGCTPNIFTGAQNTKDTGKKIENYLKEGLKDTVFPSQVNVRVVPTNYTNIMIFIDILLQNFEIDSIPFEFDFINGIKKFNKLDYVVNKPKSSIEYKINNISNIKRPNKYLQRLREDTLSL